MTKILLSKRIDACRRVAVGLLLLVSIVNKSYAGIDPPVTQALNGSLGQVALDSTVMVEDAKFFDVGYYGKLIKPYSLQNVLSLEINEHMPIIIQSDFRVTVRLAISFVRNDSTTGYEERDFEVKYFANNVYPHKDVYIFKNCARVSAQIISLSKDVGWNAYALVKVVNQLQSLPSYNYHCDSNAVKEINDSAWAANTTKDELPVYWPPSIGADEYDLEWTYIDSIALASGLYGDPGDPDANLIFDNNSSRVTITGTFYTIPLIYDNSGYLFFRVRTVQWQPGGGRNEANWSSDYTDGLGVFYYRGHERLLNWQATTTYAEDGKRKIVVQYFDGSLRGRQTVTKDNSTNTTVVAESFYDYQGRPVIQVLPAPTINTIIKYSPGFNVGLNGNIYDKFNYDTLTSPADFCDTAAAPMDTVSGAARYYSPNNELADSSFNKYIPNAFGYPFTEVQYTQDNTGRISSQSGVGEKFRINGGHETKYMYATADQRQLDALFGTEVGDASHYFKTLVRDANGQYSVSYTDMHGRTIATALAGATPDSIKLDTLDSYNTKYITQKLSDPASVVIRDLVMESKSSIPVTKEDDYVFTYKLDPDIMRMEDCSEIEICYECLYDLEITITDDCNNCKLGGVPFDTLVKNFSIGAIDTSCEGGAGFDFSFTKRLKEGSYEVTKKLTISRYGMDYYRDSFFLTTNTCKNIDSFLNEQRQLYAGVLQCRPTCGSCKDSLGTWEEFWERYVRNVGIDSVDFAANETAARTAFDRAIEECNLICDTLTSDANDIRRNMLMDMTPSSGQYANIDIDDDVYSVFFSRADGTSPDTAAIYQQINNYLDDDGNPALVYDESTGAMVSPKQLSAEAFVQKFQSSWANALLEYHPEYCKLEWYDSLKYSHEWDRRFGAVESWQEAKEKGYLNPTNSTGGVFDHFAGTVGLIDRDSMPLYAGGFWKDRLEDSLRNFRFRPDGSPDSLSMWTVATVAAVCPTSSGSCFGKFFDPENTFSYEEDLCDGEIDMAWRIFREMYLDVKRHIVNDWVKSKCTGKPTATVLIAAGHQPHFIDAREMLPLTDLNLSTNTGTVVAQYQQLINAQYDSTCKNYAVMWWKQLAPCNLKLLEDSAYVISNLITICREGSDYNHPYGSSSIAPSSTHEWESFEHFLRQYCTDSSVNYEICNPYLIPAPKPYNNQSANSNKPIYSRPDDCECDSITSYYSRYQASTGFGSFSAYMEQVHSTIVSNENLNTLMSLCESGGDTANCPVLRQPIYLPPAFQCFVGDACASCELFNALHQQFTTEVFPGIQPAAVDTLITDSAHIRANDLYERFMNYRLGFAKTVDEYFAFREQCASSLDNDDCDSLQQLVEDFKDSYFNSYGVTTEFYTQDDTYITDLHKLIKDGWVQFPDSVRALAGASYNNVSWKQKGFSNYCWGPNGYSIEFRLRFIQNLLAGHVFYANIGNMSATFARFTTSFTALGQSYGPGIYLSGLSLNSENSGYDFGGNLASQSVNHLLLSTDVNSLLTGVTVKLKVKSGGNYVLYWNGDSVTTFVRSSAVSIVNSWVYGLGLRGRHGAVDWVRMYDSSGKVRYFEDYLDADNPAIVDNDYICPTPNPDCKTAFVSYYNTQKGTSLTFEQIDSIYKASCVIGPNPCGTQTPCNQLSYWQDEFKKYGGIPELDSNGVNVKNWRVNHGSGLGYTANVPLKKVIKDGIASLPTAYADTVSASQTAFHYVDTLCLEETGFDVELRVKLHDTLLNTNADDISWWVKVGSDSTGAGSLLAALSPVNGQGVTVCTHVDDSQEACNTENVTGQHFDDWETIRLRFRGTNFKLYVGTDLLAERTLTAAMTKINYISIGQWAAHGEVDYLRITDVNGNFLYNEEFNSAYNLALPSASIKCADCEERFIDHFNSRNGSAYNQTQVDSVYDACSIPLNPCAQISNANLTLCGRAEPVFAMGKFEQPNNCSDTTFFIQSMAQELYKVYVDSLKNKFDSAYLAKCMAAYKMEQFTVYHKVNEFHHTLYYYDQAGNLIKTVPPAGVRANYDSVWLDSVYDARLAGQLKRPAHELVTQYRYNTLNQAVAQKSPDGGMTEFWYDRLGRLALSRNAKQLANSSSNKHLFSFTRYDQLGRITQVGQLRETATSSIVDDVLTRKDSALQAWLGSYENYRHQLTTTIYDTAYPGGYNNPLPILQRNLRNRVSFVTYSDTTGLAVAFNNGLFYTYDAAGNVDTLLQDYGCGSCGVSSVYNMMNRNGNRWKKIIYNYDLISGKVNTVAFQRGYADQFFQRYIYDAENRLILAESSRDSVVWEREATYQYYKHGPLARMVLGHQQVQGIDYAYTLQGWLKGMNSTGGSITHDMGEDGKNGGANQYTARDALGLTLNYFGGEYSAVNTGTNPFPNYSAFLNSAYRPLYNGNISSSSVFNRKLLGGADDSVFFYNYRYDQLNRLKGMDVYNRFRVDSNHWQRMQPAIASGNPVMQERVSYDANGNIQTYKRNHSTGTTMDDLTYSYYPNTNRLKRVGDVVADNTFPFSGNIYDIDSQTDSFNYVYDEIGNLVQDKKEQITAIKWNVYGKITEITRNSTGGVPVTTIKYVYDALGNRIGKSFDLGGNTRYTWYVRDAQGNVLSIYEANPGGSPSLEDLDLVQGERYFYGSSRLGFLGNAQAVDGGPVSMEFYSGGQLYRGWKRYELTNHLGNVLAAISDKKFGVSSGGSLNDYYNSDILEATDYYPFGMVARNTSLVIPYTRFGFNGQEFDWEAKGWMNQIDYGDRVYDPRIGKFLSTDPLEKDFPWYTPYQFAGNKPIWAEDLDGREESVSTTKWYFNDKGTVLNTTVSDEYVQPAGTFRVGFRKQTTKEIIAEAFVKSNHLPTNGNFTFVEHQFNPGANYATYEYKDAQGNPQIAHYDAKYINWMYEQLGVAQEKLDKGLGVAAATANLVGAGALMRAEIKGLASDVKIKPNNGNTATESNTATVYRTQGGELPNASRQRVVIGQDGSVAIEGDDMLYVTINDKNHQIYFYSKRGGVDKGANIVSFEIPQSLVEEIKKSAVPQAQGKQFPNSPQASDPTKSKNAYGLPKAYIEKLRQQAVQGSGKVEQPKTN